MSATAQLVVDVALHGGSCDATVYEDATGDGTADASETITGVPDGVSVHSLQSIAGDGSNEYWIDLDLSAGSVSTAPTVHAVHVSIESAVPTNVAVDSTGIDTVELSWTDSSTDETEFRVYRSATPGVTTEDTLAGTVPSPDTGGEGSTVSFTDSGLSLDTSYYYAVAAFDGSDESILSAEVAAVTNRQTETELSTEVSTTTDLPAPSGLATMATGDQIDVIWTDDAQNEDGFRVFTRRTGGSGWTQDGGDLSPNTTQHSTRSLLDGEQYDVKVEVYTADATSETILSPAATTELPDIPTGAITVNAVTEDEIEVNWT